MSDDRDDADVVPAGAAPGGRRRSGDDGDNLAPTGKAARGTDAATRRVMRTDAADSEDTSNRTLNPITYLGQVVEELRRVIWPTRNQMVTYTIVVFLFLIFMSALIVGVDLGAGRIVEMIFDR